MIDIKVTRQTIFIGIWVYYVSLYTLLWASSLKLEHNTSSFFAVLQYSTLIMLGLYFITSNISLKSLFFLCVVFLIELQITDKDLLVLTMFVVCARNIEFRKLIKVDVVVKIFWLLVILLLCLCGILANEKGYYYGVYKQSLGFQHPNTLAIYVFSIIIEILYICYYRLRYYDFVVCMIIWGIVMSITFSRTTGYSLAFVLLLMLFAQRFEWIFYSGVAGLFFVLSAPVLAVSSIILTQLYLKGSEMILKLNTMFSGRLNLQSKYWVTHEIRLLGQNFKWEIESRYVLDSGYIRCLLRYGSIFFVVMCVAYMILMRYCIKNKKIELAFMTFFFLLLGLTETSFLRIVINPTMLLFLNREVFIIKPNDDKSIRISFGWR